MESGRVQLGDDVTAVSREGVVTDKGKVTKIFRATGTSTEELDVGGKGQIVRELRYNIQCSDSHLH